MTNAALRPIFGTPLLLLATMLNVANVGRPGPLLDANMQRVGHRGVHALRRNGAREHHRGQAVVTRGRLRSHGSCTCGWQGVRHVLSALAVHDALLHAAMSRCRPAVPLVA